MPTSTTAAAAPPGSSEHLGGLEPATAGDGMTPSSERTAHTANNAGTLHHKARYRGGAEQLGTS